MNNLENKQISQKNKVALVGWDPDVVDYSKWHGLTAEKVRQLWKVTEIV